MSDNNNTNTNNNLSLSLPISYNNNDYTLNLTTLESNILHVSFGNQDISDKFKGNFTYERLVRKAPQLKILTNTVNEIAEEIQKSIEKKDFKLNVDFSKSYTVFKFFISKKNDTKFPMEFFIYKTDSKQYNEKIENLKEEIEKINLENNQLRNTNTKDIEELQKLLNENLNLKEQFNNIKQNLTEKVDKAINNMKDRTQEKVEDTEIKFKMLKKDLTKNRNNSKLDKKKLNAFVSILKEEERELLKKWFKTDFNLVLAYDSVVHGDSSVTFHEKCDGKIQTLTLIETEHGLRFGGFTKLFWDHSGGFKGNDETAFIFSLDKKTKFNCSDQDKVIYCNDKQGPTFGKGNDIFISDNFTSNSMSSSWIKGSYGEKDSIEEFYTTKNYFGGVDNFRVERIEVYQVILK